MQPLNSKYVQGMTTLTTCMMLLILLLFISLSTVRDLVVSKRIIRQLLAESVVEFAYDAILAESIARLRIEKELKHYQTGTFAGHSYHLIAEALHATSLPQPMSLHQLKLYVSEALVRQQTIRIAPLIQNLPEVAIVQVESGRGRHSFDHFFGMAHSSKRQFEAAAMVKESSCAALLTPSPVFFWINGDCEIQESLGSIDEPVLLYVDGGNLVIRDGKKVTGLVVIDRNTDVEELISRGQIIGALLTTYPASIAVEVPTVTYHQEVLERLQESPMLVAVTAIEGSLRD